jgi:hypothetical protein
MLCLVKMLVTMMITASPVVQAGAVLVPVEEGGVGLEALAVQPAPLKCPKERAVSAAA